LRQGGGGGAADAAAGSKDDGSLDHGVLSVTGSGATTTGAAERIRRARRFRAGPAAGLATGAETARGPSPEGLEPHTRGEG